ncbi:sulfite exporter TauE/SafE family protein [Inhella crocodyli]|uniref:Probable membrane transporter protein n=1 Tax=Inhella crocodyli TaxID=2499851 RepID=A0A437LS14_9BURK|nr:sulfite exporter TauE/SafE family protein [Inhella crocodyli]RVT88003.1 sulfite exporter TauE/SafE family protein [Inhella crocodyli]
MAAIGAQAGGVGVSLELLLALLALGIATGFLAGLLGIGGGMLLVPFLTALLQAKGVAEALAVKMAIATSMACIVATATSSLRAHHRRGAVRWDLVRGLAPGVVLGGLLSGAGLFAVLKGQVLAGGFAAFVGVSAWQMWRGAQPRPSRTMPAWPGQVAVGGGIGLLSGLVGAGGGFASVPFMAWCNVPIHQAVATSAALGLPIAAASTLGYVISGWNLPAALPGAWGYLYLPALACLMPVTVMMAPWGAKAAHALPIAQLKRAFALVLAALAAYMLTKAL